MVQERNRMRLWIVFSVMVAAGQSCFAAPLGNSEKGRALAEQWCASCHVVVPNQESATTEAPPFETIAKRPAEELQTLAVFLSAPHPPMPPINLSTTEIRDLVAYITSLSVPE